MINPQKITCPTCGKPNTWHSNNQFKPFCSERCKLIDLGEWANESRKIPGNAIDPERIVDATADQDDMDDQM